MAKNNVVLLIGSNINPAANIATSLERLSQLTDIKSKSSIWETEAVGSNGPNFLNIAVEIETDLKSEEIKQGIIKPIESEIKRVRTENKYAPRTIDLDIIIFNNQIMDKNLWEKVFIALPVSEIKPNLKNPNDQATLKVIANKLKNSAFAELFPKNEI